MMNLAAVLSIVSLLTGCAPGQVTPPTGPHQLAFTHTDRTEVAFLDLASFERRGDIVEAWGFFLLAQPAQTLAPMAADQYWSRITIDCAARTAQFTHVIAFVDGAVAFNGPVSTDPTPTADSWALDAAYACDGETPARPVIADVDTAIREARAIMASDAWAPAG